jgi:CheY-like chemotaxis protein
MNAPRSILLVDDDEGIREALTETLVDEGFLVHVARNGREALDWLHDHAEISYVVLLDLMMPVMDGRAFLRHRQSDPRLARVPVVVISADDGYAKVSLTHQINDCIPKPIAISRLLAAIQACA